MVYKGFCNTIAQKYLIMGKGKQLSQDFYNLFPANTYINVTVYINSALLKLP